MRRLTGCILGVFIGVALRAEGSAAIDFQREIRPILSDHCFACHGPDPETRMAGLRLDTRAAATEARKNGAAIVPGNAEASALIKRITEKSPARRMPPPYAHKTLTPAQIDLLRRWINEGAEWKEHWSFQALRKPALPAVKNAGWARHPIDLFILARLEAEGLTPAPPASPRTLIRRVALDLTGLPPTREEIQEFLADRSPNAYEKMVDRYLASPRYGEHRARYWLDAARYADTHGIHIDNYREMWPYRDWVVAAFNRNMPFDQFSVEQLAGDLLPNPTLEQRIATGFHRSGPTTSEGGVIEEEYAEIYAKDRAETTGAVWLGLTVGCASCHDHKFDPIGQRDFYALGAFFRNTTQPIMDGNVADNPPVMVVPTSADRPRWESLQAERTELKAQIARALRSAPTGIESWLQQRKPTGKARPFPAKDQLLAVDLKKLTGKAPGVRWEARAREGRPGLVFGEDKGVAVKGAPELAADQPFSIAIFFFLPEEKRNFTLAAHVDEKKKNRGWRLGVNEFLATFSLKGEDSRAVTITAVPTERMAANRWHHVMVTYDGSRRHDGLTMYIDGQAVATRGKTLNNLRVEGAIHSRKPLMLGGAFKKGAVADLRIFRRELNEAEAAYLKRWPEIEQALAETANEASRDLVALYYLFQEDRAFQDLVARQGQLQAEARTIARRGGITHVMQERDDQEPHAHILFRGAYDQKRDRVGADTPAVLPPMPEELPRNRLGFAQWLFRPENPLTARVTVNRMWQEVFGVGLVKTADDFGSQGEPPSHPELLDWLAVDFRENGWDMKRFYKQILMSATYRQAAVTTPEKLEKDPENRLLSRGPRFRMDGEMIRDYALAVSGLLSGKMGGPSVKPYQPEGIWEAVAMKESDTRFYQRDRGESLYRRSLYTFIKRSAPPPNMEIFNAPTREACTIRRERTNTPLQALVTMNDEQFVEAARFLAERTYLAASDADGWVNYMAEVTLGRPLEEREREIARAAYRDYLRYFDTNRDAAQKLLAVGEKPAAKGLDPGVHAALTMLANQFLNLDEVLTK